MLKTKVFSFFILVVLGFGFLNSTVVSAQQISAQACFDTAADVYTACIKATPDASAINWSEGTIGPDTAGYGQASDLCDIEFIAAQEKCAELPGAYTISNIGGLINPLAGQTVPSLFGNITRAVLGEIGVVALILFIYAGVKWMTARGNPEQVKKATQIMVWATLGLIMIFSSYILLEFVFKALK